MTMSGCVAEYLSHMQKSKPATSHIFMSTLSHKSRIIQEYIV